MELYQKFAGEVISSFLSEDKRGEFVSLVIDEQFMDETESKIGATRDSIIQSIYRVLSYTYNYRSANVEFPIAMVAIQLYAASIMTDNPNKKYTVRAYYKHINDLFGGEDCRNWLIKNDYNNITNQDKLWECFFNWCDSRNLLIANRKSLIPAPYEITRNTQYPLTLARYTFNREDLKYISCIFHKNKILVGEDIRYTDFWKLFDVRWSFKSLSNHTTKVFESIYTDTHSYDIAKSQIYNHFLTWNGEYKEPYTSKSRVAVSLNDKQISVSNKSGIYELYVRNNETETLIEKISVDRKLQSSLKTHYRFKRDGIILFQQNKGYLNVWDETRYIEDQSTSGLAIVFGSSYRFRNATQLHYCDNVYLYEFDYNNQTKEFYSEEPKIYELIGGLRVGRQTYLTNGAPVLRLYRDSFYLLNGKTVNQVQGDHCLDLDEGEHILKFQRRMELKITIVPPSIKKRDWADKFCKWELNRKEFRWTPRRDIDGVIGLNYHRYSTSLNSQSVLQRWAKAHQREIINNDNNIALKLLNNQNRYE